MYNEVDRSIANNLCTEQMEADTKIILHVCNTFHKNADNSSKPINIKIVASDTDILIIMLYNIKHMLLKDNVVWMEAGTGSSKRLINVTKMQRELTEAVCDCLPGLHAISGCDFNPSTYNMGKAKWFKAVLSNPIFLDALHK